MTVIGEIDVRMGLRLPCRHGEWWRPDGPLTRRVCRSCGLLDNGHAIAPPKSGQNGSNRAGGES